MKPILFEYDEEDFTSNGIGRLSPTRCIVTEERNGQFELEMDISIEDKHYAEIQEGRILYAPHDETKTRQPFEIYMISRPMGGVVTVNAHHISYRTAKITVMPCTAGSAAAALQALKTNSVTEHPFVFNTDLVAEASFHVDKPETMRSRFAGVEGSILGVYGGEYEWDKFTIYLRSSRGTDTDVILRYGKNITSLKKTTDASDAWTGIVPYWYGTNSEGGAEDLVTLPEKAVLVDDDDSMLIPLDMSSYFNQKPTVAELRQKATKYVQDNAPDAIPVSIDVSFIQLWQTQEYADVAPMERLRLCDTLTIKHDKLGVSNRAKVVKTVYDVLLERYESMTVGSVRPSMGDAIQAVTSDIKKSIVRKSTMQAMIEAMANLMQGGLGGHMVVNTDNNGKPNELLFMNTDNKNTAVNVLRINMNGIAFSKNGYNGPFTTAWSIDGTFYADWIAAGNLDATLLTVGIIKDALNKNSWDLASGMLITTLAIIGGIHINTNSMYSGDHSSIDSTAAGFYFGSDGTFSIGDGDQYLKFKIDIPEEIIEDEPFEPGEEEEEEEEEEPVYTLEMMLDRLVIGPSKKSVTDSTFSGLENDIANAAKTASNFIHFSAANGLVISQDGSASGSVANPYNTQIVGTGINFRKNTTNLASFTGDLLTFFRGLTGKKGAEFGATNLTFYKSDGTTEAAKIGNSGLEVLSGILGGFEADNTKFQSVFTDDGGNQFKVTIRKPVERTTKVIEISRKLSTEGSFSDLFYIRNNGEIYGYSSAQFGRTGMNYLRVDNDTPTNSTMLIGRLHSDSDNVRIYSASSTTSGNIMRLYSGNIIDGWEKIYKDSSSSKRYKDHVCDMPIDYAKQILNILPVIFRYKDGYLAAGDECEGKEVPGFYAEDVEKYYPMGVYHNSDGSVENWKPDRLIPAMLKVIQEQQKELDNLKKAVKKIKGAVAI